MASGSRVNDVPKPSVVHASLSLRSELPLGDMTRHMAAAPDVLAALFDVRTGRIIVYHRPKPLAHSYHEAGAPKIVSSRQARGNVSHPDHVFFSFFAWLGAQARYAKSIVAGMACTHASPRLRPQDRNAAGHPTVANSKGCSLFNSTCMPRRSLI